jgi:hypothetical protein
MSITSTADPHPLKQRGRPRGRQPRSRIDLPNGEWLQLRVEFAEVELGVCEKTLARMKPDTRYIGGYAYVPHNATLQMIADGGRRRNEPPKQRRRR